MVNWAIRHAARGETESVLYLVDTVSSLKKDLAALQGRVNAVGDLNHLFDLAVLFPFVLEIVGASDWSEAHAGEAFNNH
jgi:hypothetical protein